MLKNIRNAIIRLPMNRLGRNLGGRIPSCSRYWKSDGTDWYECKQYICCKTVSLVLVVRDVQSIPPQRQEATFPPSSGGAMLIKLVGPMAKQVIKALQAPRRVTGADEVGSGEQCPLPSRLKDLWERRKLPQLGLGRSDFCRFYLLFSAF